MIALKLTTPTGGERYLLAKEVRRGPLCIIVNTPTERSGDWWIISPKEKTTIQLFHYGQHFSEFWLPGGGTGDTYAKFEVDQTVVIKKDTRFICEQCGDVAGTAEHDVLSGDIDWELFSFAPLGEVAINAGCTKKSHTYLVAKKANDMKLHVMDYINQITTGA